MRGGGWGGRKRIILDKICVIVQRKVFLRMFWNSQGIGFFRSGIKPAPFLFA
jgi:hypothetical protein